jgi:hypothetical protein
MQRHSLSQGLAHLLFALHRFFRLHQYLFGQPGGITTTPSISPKT